MKKKDWSLFFRIHLFKPFKASIRFGFGSLLFVRIYFLGLEIYFNQNKRKQLMRFFFILALGAGLSFFIWKRLESPEAYLKKQTKKLIALSSVKNEKGLALISKVSKTDKYIHFDVRMKAEYEGQVYTAESLNEFRSLLMAYFRQKQTGALVYENLIVQMKGEKTGKARFDAFFNRKSKTVFCKIILEWIKEKKWYVKKIDVFSCKNQA